MTTPRLPTEVLKRIDDTALRELLHKRRQPTDVEAHMMAEEIDSARRFKKNEARRVWEGFYEAAVSGGLSSGDEDFSEKDAAAVADSMLHVWRKRWAK